MMSFVKSLKRWLESNALSDGFIVQLYQWEDRDGITPYLVIQPDGGSVQIPDHSNEHYFLLSLIADKNTGYAIESKARQIMSAILTNPITEFGYLECTGGLPMPIFTTDNRMILRLSLRLINTQIE